MDFIGIKDVGMLMFLEKGWGYPVAEQLYAQMLGWA
jgi:hypothetical protein